MRVGIAGAGLIGRLLAMRLLQQGHHITLFDKDDHSGKQSCGLVAAGMLSPFAEIDAESLIIKLGKMSLALWPQWLAELPEPVDFNNQGSLLVAHLQDEIELERFKKKFFHRHGNLNAEECTREKIDILEPELSKSISQGLFFIEEASIDNIQLFSALEKFLQRNATQWHINTEVIAVKPQHISTHKENFEFDYVFDCRGLGAKNNLPGLRGVRGELIIVHAPEVNLNRPIRMLHPRYPVYVVPRKGNHYVIGATSIESEDHSPISVRSMLELLSAAYSLHPGFAEARVIKTEVQCRPAFADNLPKIIAEPGLISINGLYRHGCLVAPALVEQAIGML